MGPPVVDETAALQPAGVGIEAAGARGHDRLALNRFRVPLTALVTAGAAALVIATAGLVALLAPGQVYGSVPQALSDAATAQDLVGLVVAGPSLLALVVLSRQGSFSAWACSLGLLSFVAYNAAVYCFSIPFGPMFLVWVALLGLSACALVSGLTGLREPDVPVLLDDVARRATGCFLVATGAVFALLWLGQIIPDLMAGGPSTSAATWGVPTNPVHVLDLALFLPAVLTSGVLVLRGHWFGAATAAGQLVFLGLTCLPILVTPLVAAVRGHTTGWQVVPPIVVVLVAVALVLVRVLRAQGRGGRKQP